MNFIVNAVKNSIFVAIALLLSSCAGQESSPIEYHHKDSRTQNQDITESVKSRPKRNIAKSSDSEHSGPIKSKPLKKEHFETTQGTLKDKHANEKPVVVAKPDENKKLIYHEVQTGETIEQIAENYNISVAEIAKLNDLSEPYELEEAQVLKIKTSSKTLNAQNAKHAGELKTEITPAAAPKSNFTWPVEGKVIVKFGQDTGFGKNAGINIEAEAGTEIKAVASGVVAYANTDSKFGNLVIIKIDGKDIYTAYAHMKELKVKKGDKIKQNTVIGLVGATGNVDSPQLHFAIREGKVAVDPMKYLSAKNNETTTETTRETSDETTTETATEITPEPNNDD